MCSFSLSLSRDIGVCPHHRVHLRVSGEDVGDGSFTFENKEKSRAPDLHQHTYRSCGGRSQQMCGMASPGLYHHRGLPRGAPCFKMEGVGGGGGEVEQRRPVAVQPPPPTPPSLPLSHACIANAVWHVPLRGGHYSCTFAKPAVTKCISLHPPSSTPHQRSPL
jgi:hypothetical protein